MAEDKPYAPGLAGIPAARSRVCYLDGAIGKLQYRGYAIEALAESCTFEEVVYLLFHDALPTEGQLEAFRGELEAVRTLPPEVREVLSSLPKRGHPMAALQAGLLAASMADAGDQAADPDHHLRTAVRIVALTPVIVAAWHRIRSGLAPIESPAGIGHAASFLHMLTGEEPSELAAHVMDVALVLHAEHTMNASTFACRVVGSTLADPYTTLSAAVGALSGPLHGGANERVLAMLGQLEGEDQVRPWAEERLARKDKITGFGHRVYKVKDPRATILQELATRLFAESGRTPIYDLAVRLERELADLVGHRGIYPNVDFYSGIVYQKLGVPTDVFTPIFAISRVSGWLAHLLEQLEDNRIFRPTQIWTGDADRKLVPIAERG